MSFFGARRRRLPLLSLRIGSAALTFEQQELETTRTHVRSEFAAQLVAWSRAAQTWEPLLGRTGCVVQAQQQFGGMWSIFCEWEALEFTLSDAMIRSLIANNEAMSRILDAPSFADALAQREPELELQVGVAKAERKAGRPAARCK